MKGNKLEPFCAEFAWKTNTVRSRRQKKKRSATISLIFFELAVELTHFYSIY